MPSAGAGVAAFPGAGPDTPEEKEERCEYAGVVTLAEEEEEARVASQWRRHRSANAAHGTPPSALASPVPACPGLTMPCGVGTVSRLSSSDASSASSSTRSATAYICICWVA